MKSKPRYRIIFPRPIGDKFRTKCSEFISHWIVSMNGFDHLAYFHDGRVVRNAFRHKEI